MEQLFIRIICHLRLFLKEILADIPLAVRYFVRRYGTVIYIGMAKPDIPLALALRLSLGNYFKRQQDEQGKYYDKSMV